MIFLNILVVVLCFTGALGSPLTLPNSTYHDEFLRKFLSKTKDDEDFQRVIPREDWFWTKTSTVIPPFASLFNFTDFTGNTYYKPRDPIMLPNFKNDIDTTGYDGGSSYTTYTTTSRRSDYSGIIIIVLLIKFILWCSCYGCRNRSRQTPRPSVVRIPNNAQPNSLTVIRRHIFVVVPQNGHSATGGDDSNDPGSHLEHKTLVNEDLPPSYEEVALSNKFNSKDSNPDPASTIPSGTNTPSVPPPPQYV